MARKMKDSGIEWIGEIPEGWEIGQIGQLYSERRTKVSDKDYPPLSVTMKGILPQLSTAAKTDAHDDRKLVCKGDFAINSRSDRRGSCGISEQDGSISLINTVLQPRGEMNPGYYNWLFHTSMFADEFYKWGHGIVDDLWTTGWSDMKKIGVPVPSKCEQKQLAEHLNVECSHIDSILSKTRASIEEYKKLKQAVITQAVTKGVRGEREMKDSGVEWIGRIPSEWYVAPFTKCLESTIDYRGKTPEKVSDGTFLVTAKNIKDGKLNYSASKEYVRTEQYEDIMHRGKPEIGDVLFTTEAPLGEVCNVDRTDFALAQRIIKFRGIVGLVNNYYMKYWIMSSFFQNNLRTFATGSTAQGIKASKLGQLKLILPTLEEQQEIADYLDAKCAEIDKLIAKKEQLVKELESYKKSLIYEVVTGKREIFTDITRKFPNI